MLHDLPPSSLHNKIGLFNILMKPGNGELSITVGETYRSLHSDFQLIARSSKLRMIRETSSAILWMKNLFVALVIKLAIIQEAFHYIGIIRNRKYIITGIYRICRHVNCAEHLKLSRWGYNGEILHALNYKWESIIHFKRCKWKASMSSRIELFTQRSI